MRIEPEDQEEVNREVWGLQALIGDNMHLAISCEGRFFQIAYRIPRGANRSVATFLRAVWMFGKYAWRSLS